MPGNKKQSVPDPHPRCVKTMAKYLDYIVNLYMLLLLLSCFSHVRLCVTPETADHQAPPFLGTLEWVAISFSNA